jgi:hypothetical protein
VKRPALWTPIIVTALLVAASVFVAVALHSALGWVMLTVVCVGAVVIVASTIAANRRFEKNRKH